MILATPLPKKFPKISMSLLITLVYSPKETFSKLSLLSLVNNDVYP